MSETTERPATELSAAELVLQRHQTHGDFAEGAFFTQSVMRLAASMPSWDGMTDAQREGFHMIVHKMQRIVSGNPNHKDHWVDIGGYAYRVASYLPKEDKQ